MYRFVLKTIFLIIFSNFYCYSNHIIILFRNDDINYRSNVNFEHETLKIFQKYNIKPLYSVIPALNGVELKKGMPIVDSLISWRDRGWIDIGVHGYTHQYQFSKLLYDEQIKRIKAGKEIIENLFHPNNLIFVPPWNSVNVNTLKILEKTGFNVFSGYLGEKPINKMKFINCNINLFDGPLGSIIDLFPNIVNSKNDVLIVALFHTNYDFNKKSLKDLDSLLYFLSSQNSVVFSSFSDLIKTKKYSDFLRTVNSAGYYLKLFENNKLIKRIGLKLPILSNYIKKEINNIRENYWKGNYTKVEEIYRKVLIILGTLISLTFVLTFYLLIKIYKRLK